VRVKHEAWYVLAAEPGGAIYHGLETGVTAERFRKAMLNGEVEGVLRRVPVRAGECYYLPSGTVHALGAGVLVAEIQTPSDVTYRTYDWGRVDPSTDRPRELHLDKAIACMDFSGPQPEPTHPVTRKTVEGVTISRLTSCPSFAIDRVEMAAGGRRRMRGGEPVVWIVLEGAGRFDGPGGTAFGKGDVILLPAAMGVMEARVEIPTTCLEVTVPY
jgi:mannose-6-phosphate isomerase